MPKTAAKEPYCALYEFRPRDKQDIYIRYDYSSEQDRRYYLRPGDKLYVFDARDDNWWFVSHKRIQYYIHMYH